MIIPTNRLVNGKRQYHLIINGQLIAAGSIDEIKAKLEELE